MPPKEEPWIDEHGDITTSTISRNLVPCGKEKSNTKKDDKIPATAVAIDGILYDLDGFHHPGGASINLFGGNDVTVLYKMIHPHHSQEYHSKKMVKVGDKCNRHTNQFCGPKHLTAI